MRRYSLNISSLRDESVLCKSRSKELVYNVCTCRTIIPLHKSFYFLCMLRWARVFMKVRWTIGRLRDHIKQTSTRVIAGEAELKIETRRNN